MFIDTQSQSNITVQDEDQNLEDLIEAFERSGTTSSHESAYDSASSYPHRQKAFKSHANQSEPSSRDPMPRPTNQNNHSLNQVYPSNHSLNHRFPPTNHPPSSADYSSSSENHQFRFYSTAIPPLHNLPSSPGSTFNFVGGNQSNNQNTYYSGPTYNIKGNNIQGGVQGGVNNYY
jgi:hypothetical protein